MPLSIRQQILWSFEQEQVAYFHPRACVVRGAGPTASPGLFMTLQPVTGSDVFHQVMWRTSADLGETWTAPEPVPGFGWQPFFDNVFEGVCDVVPSFHAPTGAILAIGHSVYYQDNHLLDTMGDWKQDNVGYQRRVQRCPVYAVRTAAGAWLPRRRLEAPGFADASIYTCGSSQRLDLPDGGILLPISHGRWNEKPRRVCTLRCAFDGEVLRVLEKSRDFELPVGRGLLEPSLACFHGRYFITIRAEDGHGHVATSADGLHWDPLQPWRWQDGEALDMSTTQQHWLEHGDSLYLVYNRRDAANPAVMRWRAPLYIAKVDPEAACLLRETEQVVFPLLGDGTAKPSKVPAMGNFHPCRISSQTAIITVGEECAFNAWRGNTLIAWLRG